MALKVYQTRDLSNTLYVEELDETYHSRNGALEESLHVFMKAGLTPLLNTSDDIHILEVGFGTGLNAILTYEQSLIINPQATVHYHTIEAFPLPPEIITQLHYEELIHADSADVFHRMHHATWHKTAQISNRFWLTKHHVRLQDFTPDRQFDLIYFDAFAPDKQPELWHIDIFAKLYLCMNLNGILVTYSSKGEVKRNLRQVGFEVQRLTGPPNKRHMLRALKK